MSASKMKLLNQAPNLFNQSSELDTNQPWSIGADYDSRFGAILILAKHGNCQSPVHHIRVSDLFRDMPQHELRALLKYAKQPKVDDISIDTYRERAIVDSQPAGKLVLDVGGYDGSMASLALTLGASRAICLDNHQYEHYGWEDKKLAGVEYIQGDFMDYEREDGVECSYIGYTASPYGLYEIIPCPDILIFYNCLYHLKNPWAALDRLRSMIKPDGTMLLCTLFRYHDGPWMYVYNPKECNPTDDTVYFGPSIEALERLLTHTGWEYQQVGLALDRVVYTCKPIKDWERTHEDS